MITGINLLPWRKELRRKNERYFRIQVSVIFMLAVVILTLWHLILWRQINIAAKQTDRIRKQLALLEKRPQDKNNNKQQERQLSQMISLEQQRLGLIKIFENLHCGMAANARLTQLIIKGGNCILFGKADSMFGITKLIKNFIQAKHDAAPMVQKINKEGDEYNFILSLADKA